MMEEIWIDIEGYEGKYEVSNLGRVRSLDQMLSYASRWGTIAYRPTKGKVLTQRTISGGYKGVLIKVQGKTEMKLVHRLVANAFVPNPQNLETVNHIDEDKTNNHVDNLEWCTRKYNQNYNEHYKIYYKPVIQFTKDGTEVGRYESLKAAQEATGVPSSYISGALRGRQRTAGGFRWQFQY